MLKKIIICAVVCMTIVGSMSIGASAYQSKYSAGKGFYPMPFTQCYRY